MATLDLAAIGNCAIASLIDRNARHVWFCFPRLDGDPVFSALINGEDPQQGQRFRVGIEGRISVLFRGRGMKRCLLKGRERFEILVGAAVLANNLMRIADLLDKQDKRKPNRRRAAA